MAAEKEQVTAVLVKKAAKLTEIHGKIAQIQFFKPISSIVSGFQLYLVTNLVIFQQVYS